MNSYDIPDTRRGVGVNPTGDESDQSLYHSRQRYKGLGNGVAVLATSATFFLWWKCIIVRTCKFMMVKKINRNNMQICAGEINK